MKLITAMHAAIWRIKRVQLGTTSWLLRCFFHCPCRAKRLTADETSLNFGWFIKCSPSLSPSQATDVPLLSIQLRVARRSCYMTKTHTNDHSRSPLTKPALFLTCHMLG